MVHRSGKTNRTNPLSQRPDFEQGVELNNKAQILLPDTLFPIPHSPDEDKVAVRLLQVENSQITLRLLCT